MLLFRSLTLGCKVNQYETEYVREGLRRLGYREAADGEPADLCIVNTCTVTVEGEAKSRKLIRQFARQNPRAEIVVMGCYATRAAAEVAALPGVAEVIADKRQLPEWLARRGLVDIPAGISRFGSRHRAYVKVQDGCRMECSYCIVPRVRPVLSSRPADEVLDEVRRLVENGYREIVLTGIHLGHYGTDFESTGRRGEKGEGRREKGEAGSTLAPLPSPFSLRGAALVQLLRQLATLPGDFRIRLSSIEAAEVTPELLALMAEFPERVCPHLHIPMQSGSDAVLRRMRRAWPAERFVERCREVCDTLDQPALTTDVIVGFPGEADDDFAATCRVIEEVGFSKLHIFRFSPRDGTLAAVLPDRVHGLIMHQRAAALAELGERLRQRYFEGLAGRRLQVLVETRVYPARGTRLRVVCRWERHTECAGYVDDQPGTLLGTCERYAPVELPGGDHLIGHLVPVTAGPLIAGHIRAACPKFPLAAPCPVC